jgi:tRNA 2-selenouridine synthase
MPASPHPHALPVHPHQLEVQEFDTYDLIVDLRACEAFDRDHIPRAVSVPWARSSKAAASDEGTAGADEASLAAMEPPPMIPYALEARVASLAPGSSILLYCGQGGAISASVQARLAARGFAVDILPGGWDSYRRWITAGIEVLARSLSWRWLRSGPGGASQMAAQAMAGRGEQVLAMGELLNSALVPGLLLDSTHAGAPAFASRLVDALRRMDPAHRVWIDEVIAVSGGQVLPTPLHEAMRHAEAWRIEPKPDCRIDLLQQWLGRSGVTVATLADSCARALAGALGDAIDPVRDLLAAGQERIALAALLSRVLDPLYESLAVRSAEGRERPISLMSTSPADVDRLATQLAAAQIRP